MRFDASPARIVNGMERFGKIAGALFPPTPGDAFWELVKAMLESVGMAFLGTLIAAVIAVPLGFLGARNVLPIRVLRFPIRRSFDFLRGVDALVGRWLLPAPSGSASRGRSRHRDDGRVHLRKVFAELS